MFGMGFQNIVKQQKNRPPSPIFDGKKALSVSSKLSYSATQLLGPNILPQDHKIPREIRRWSPYLFLEDAKFSSWSTHPEKMFQQDQFNTKSWFPNWIIKELMTVHDFFLPSNGSPDPTEK